jgi:hypothetical protein
MEPIYLLKELNLFDKCKTVLDVGTRDGDISKRFSEYGKDVTAIDINYLPIDTNSFIFHRISVENFLENNIKKFDLVIIKDVLHLTEDPIKIIKELYKISEVLMFTIFGTKDSWTNINDVNILKIKNFFSSEEVVFMSESEQYSPDNNGNNKFWHTYTFVISKSKISSI